MLIRPLFFFNDTATTEIYTLSLHDALPICLCGLVRLLLENCGLRGVALSCRRSRRCGNNLRDGPRRTDRKSTRLNSSHMSISYAVFCLKKKKLKIDVFFLHHFPLHNLLPFS